MYRSARGRVKDTLASAGIAQGHFEADQLITHVLGISRAALHAHPNRPVSEGDMKAILALAARRAKGEPLAYILGDALFCGRTFRVTNSTLIPRPETEVMTLRADEYMKRADGSGKGGRIFADWCTGSGCIAITLLLDNPGWRAYAADKSEEALGIASENASLHGVADRIKFILCDAPHRALSEIEPLSLGLIVSNPPYIPTADIGLLEEQVRLYEPPEALDGGDDGLGVCRLLLKELPPFMKEGSLLLMETGGESQVKKLSSESYKSINFHENFPDQRDIYRFMVWRKLQ